MGSKKGYKRKKMNKAISTAKAKSGMTNDAKGGWVKGKCQGCTDSSYDNGWSGALGHKA